MLAMYGVHAAEREHACVSMEVKHRWCPCYPVGRLLDEVCCNLIAVLGYEMDVLEGKADRSGALYKNSRALWLFWEVEQGVLVMVQRSHDDGYEDDEDGFPAIQVVYQDDDEQGRATDAPKPLQQEP